MLTILTLHQKLVFCGFGVRAVIMYLIEGLNRITKLFYFRGQPGCCGVLSLL